MKRFDELAVYLRAIPSDAGVPSELPALEDEEQTLLPFYEAYFSNFIEGTEFSVEEVEAIVVSGAVPRNEYQTALRLLYREGRCDLYARTLAYADQAQRSASPARDPSCEGSSRIARGRRALNSSVEP